MIQMHAPDLEFTRHLNGQTVFDNEKQMKKYTMVLTVIAGLTAMPTLCCRPSKNAEIFYVRACETGRLIGPISLTTGHPLPPLDEQNYIIADPAASELEIRKYLLESSGYESHYFDSSVDEVVETINLMLKHRLGDKAPPVRVEGVDALITMEIGSQEAAYDVLCNIAAQAKARIFAEDGAVVLSQRPLKEIAGKTLVGSSK